MACLMNYTIQRVDVASGQTDTPWSGRTASGYGRNLPTSRLVQTETAGPWRRVYCVCMSNAGTCYVRIKGQRVIVEGVE